MRDLAVRNHDRLLEFFSKITKSGTENYRAIRNDVSALAAVLVAQAVRNVFGTFNIIAI